MNPDEPLIQDERAGLLSASSAERVYYCLGSLRAAREAIEAGLAPPAEEIAAQGDRIHEALATEGEEDSDEAEDEEDSELTEDEAEIVSQLSQIGLGCLADWQIERGIELPEIRREERLWIRNDSLEPIASAKPDLHARAGFDGFVLDFKSGYKPITDAPSNIQLRLQALSLWHEADKELTLIRVAAAQYRLVGQRIFADYTDDDLKRAEQELLFVLWRANQRNAPKVAGPWCTYCPARAVCREAAAYSMLPVPAIAWPSKIEPETVTKDIVMELIPKMSPEELYTVWQRSTVIYKILRAVKARLAQLPDEVLDGLGIYKRPGAPTRVIKDIRKTWSTLRPFITEEEFVACCKASIVDLENVFARKTKEQHGTIKAGRKVFTDKLKDAEAIFLKPRGFRMIEKKKELQSSDSQPQTTETTNQTETNAET